MGKSPDVAVVLNYMHSDGVVRLHGLGESRFVFDQTQVDAQLLASQGCRKIPSRLTVRRSNLARQCFMDSTVLVVVDLAYWIRDPPLLTEEYVRDFPDVFGLLDGHVYHSSIIDNCCCF